MIKLLKRIKHKLFSSYKRMKLLSGKIKPVRVLLESTNRCNLNCPFCLVGQQNTHLQQKGDVAHDLLHRKFGYMSDETFNLAKKQLKDFGIKWVYLHFQGESFLNRKTPGFARQLKEDGFDVGIFTNGLAFREKAIPEIKEANFNLIRFSVDGASEKTYQQNRVGGKFADVYKSMKTMVDVHKGTDTRVEWQFIPMRNNEHEVEKARTIADEIGINFFLKGFRETDPQRAPENPQYRSNYMKKPCTDIYEQIGIYWNGDVVPCCYDTDGEEIMGNIHETDLNTIWNSPKYVEFRRRVKNFEKEPENEPDICKSCLRWK